MIFHYQKHTVLNYSPPSSNGWTIPLNFQGSAIYSEYQAAQIFKKYSTVRYEKKPQSIRKNIKRTDEIVVLFQYRSTFFTNKLIFLCFLYLWVRPKQSWFSNVVFVDMFTKCFSSLPSAQMGQVAAGWPLCDSQVDPAILHIFTFKETSNINYWVKIQRESKMSLEQVVLVHLILMVT